MERTGLTARQGVLATALWLLALGPPAGLAATPAPGAPAAPAAPATDSTTATAEPAAPPLAPRRNVPTRLHDGTMVEDPYRWMEDPADPRLHPWLRAQGSHTRSLLDRIDARADIARRLAERARERGDSFRDLMLMPDQRWYYLRRGAGERQYRLVMRQGPDGAERVLVDPDYLTRRTGVPHAVSGFRPAWDGRHLAYGIAAAGSENTTLFIINLGNGQPVGRPVPRVLEDTVHWLPDSRSLTFTQWAEPGAGRAAADTYKDSRTLWLRLDGSAPQAVFGPGVQPDPGLDRLDVAQLITAPGSRWLLARTTDTTVPEGKLFAAPVSQLGQPGLRWRRLAGEADRLVDVQLQGDTAYVLTQAGAPRRQVLALNLAEIMAAPEDSPVRGALAAAEPAEGVLEGMQPVPGGLVTRWRQGTQVSLRRHALGDPIGRSLPMPGPGAARLAQHPTGDSDTLVYTLSRWAGPPQAYLLRGDVSVPVPWATPATPSGLPELEITEATAPAADGTPVPLTVLHRKGLPLDGRRPVLLHGYGAYGLSESAHFSLGDAVWIERGGVVVHVNPRGSGVHGDTWHRAGWKTTKPNTWRDGLAAARWLIQQGYATPATLAVVGHSAGGIFAGRAMTEAPQLFAAAVLSAGLLDTVRAETSANGATNTREFGSLQDPAEALALLQMSTYHAIEPGTSYPGVLLLHGLNDPRVDVWHSAKTAARLQQAQADDRRARPVLLRLDAQAGHGAGNTLPQRLAQEADLQAFVLWQMGLATLLAEPPGDAPGPSAAPVGAAPVAGGPTP